MTRKVRTIGTLPGMPPRTPKRTLQTKRLIALLNQLKTETGLAMVHVAREHLGIDSTIPSKLTAGDTSFRNASGSTIERVIEKTGIDPRFFSDPSLGANPDYRLFVRRAPDGAPSAGTATKQAAASKRAVRNSIAHSMYGGLVDLPEEALRALDSMYASVDERAVFSEVLADCRFPFVNQALVQGIISGIRKGQRMTQYVDTALGASIDQEIAKTGRKARAADNDDSEESGDDAKA